jgi:hypothetical protein
MHKMVHAEETNASFLDTNSFMLQVLHAVDLVAQNVVRFSMRDAAQPLITRAKEHLLFEGNRLL